MAEHLNKIHGGSVPFTAKGNSFAFILETSTTVKSAGLQVIGITSEQILMSTNAI
jgi:hypothetical protein